MCIRNHNNNETFQMIKGKAFSNMHESNKMPRKKNWEFKMKIMANVATHIFVK